MFLCQTVKTVCRTIAYKNRIKKVERYLELLEILSEDKEISKERAVFLRAVLRRDIISNKAVIDWCNETIEEMGHFA